MKVALGKRGVDLAVNWEPELYLKDMQFALGDTILTGVSTVMKLESLAPAVMRQQSISVAGVNVGSADLPAERLRADFDAVLLAAGAGHPRDLPVPGRELTGIHFAMEYLTLQNKRCEGDVIPDEAFITAKDKHVVIIGGGDTGSDCVGTSNRQGAASITQFELLPMPPDVDRNPVWPYWPVRLRTSSSHEEGNRTTASAKASGSSAMSASLPWSMGSPSTPMEVDTMGFSMAIASNTLSRVPPPIRSGMT